LKTQTAAAPASDREFVVSRVFDAPLAKVFAAWTEQKQMLRWWGPRIVTNEIPKFEVRPGGTYRIVTRMPDGVGYPMTGEFREVTPPSRLVMTMDCSEHPAAWHDMVKPGRSKEDRNPAGIIVTTVLFEAEGKGTRVTVRMQFESAEICENMTKIGLSDGWGQSLDKLAELLRGR